MYEIINWKDHAVSPANTFKVTENSDGTVTLEQAGKVIQKGTKMSAANFGPMDYGVFEAIEMANENARMIARNGRKISGLTGTRIQVTLTNSQTYPFNNSKKTVQLPESRNTTDYIIYPEIVSCTDGAVGDIEFTDKLLNGFKVAYTGSASQAVLNLYVQGGI